MKHLIKEPGLLKLLQQAELYQALLDLGRSSLPDNLSDKLAGVSVEQQVLVCIVEQSAWAAKLRFFEQPLLQAYQQNLPHLNLNQVQFKVRQIQPREQKVIRNANRPNSEAAEQMRELSKTLPEGLAQAILRLSQRAKD